MAQPNILLIITDQQRWDSLGCYGVPGVHTPNLDALAADGRCYNGCYVNNPICTPSRASLWTGKHITGHGVNCLHDVLPDDEVLFPARLAELGYDTALFGKLHVSGHLAEADGKRHPHDGFRLYEWVCDPRGFRGMDTAYLDWLDERDPVLANQLRDHDPELGHIPTDKHLTTWTAERTIDYLEGERLPEKPFFCCMSVFDPHNPYHNHPAEYEDGVDADALPPIVAPDESFAHRPMAHELEARYSYMNSLYGDATPDDMDAMRLGYHAAVSLIDQQVGRVLQALDDQGLADDTIVIFSSDHGDMLGDHGLLAKGCFFYEACTRVPLLIRAPGITTPGSVSDEFCQWHDIGATLLLSAGAKADDVRQWMPDARNLLDDNALRERGFAACLYRNTGVSVDRDAETKGYADPPRHATMWRTDRWKLNVYHTAHGDRPGGELYDLSADPDELNSLWDDPDHADIRQALTLDLMTWLVEQDFQGRGRGRGAEALPDGFSV